MAKKKTKDRPKHVSIHFEHLLFDLDFMSNEYAGIILKMIVWYSADTEEYREKIKQMEQYIDTLPERGWLTSMYQRVFASIDEDLDKYADKCEKQRKRIQDYWDKRNSEVNDEIPRNTTVNDGIPRNTTATNTIRYDTIRTELSKDNNNNNNINNSSSSSSNVRMCEENSKKNSSLIESGLNKWKRSDIVKKGAIPELTDIWIEEVGRLVSRFNKQGITEEAVRSYYEDFKAQEVAETLETTYGDWRKHFGNFVRKSVKQQQEEETKKQKEIARHGANQDYNSESARAARLEGASQVMRELYENGKQYYREVPDH